MLSLVDFNFHKRLDVCQFFLFLRPDRLGINNGLIMTSLLILALEDCVVDTFDAAQQGLFLADGSLNLGTLRLRDLLGRCGLYS